MEKNAHLAKSLVVLSLSLVLHSALDTASAQLFVNGVMGNDRATGDQQHPLKSLSAAIARLPDPLDRSFKIEWTGGNEQEKSGNQIACLHLSKRMKPGVSVSILGQRGPDIPKMSWEGGAALVDVVEGEWWLENIQIGTGTKSQRRGVMVSGPAKLTLKNITFRTCSFSDAAIYAHRGGLVELRGAIRINEHLHERAEAETFAGIIATDHGIVRFVEREGASLDIGNGSLSASYYGVIRLGCESARITSWGEQNNCLAVNNSGRIDLHNTTTRLSARVERNTPIGLEHDGHILAEGAKIIIESINHNGIYLQKASTLACNDIVLKSKCSTTLRASSGSMFIGGFHGDLAGISATTGASINIEAVDGTISGPTSATAGGIISLPDGKVLFGK